MYPTEDGLDSCAPLLYFRGVTLTGIYVNGTNVMPPDDPPRAVIDTGVSATAFFKSCILFFAFDCSRYVLVACAWSSPDDPDNDV